jgi:RNA polymerase sigma factor (sigma-70 family)
MSNNGKTHVAGLYQRLAPGLRQRARGLLKDSEEAREVVQETFLAFMRAQPSLRGEASHSTVIHAIFIKRVKNCLRQRARSAARTETLDLEEDAHASGRWEAATAHDGGSGGVEARKELAALTRGESPQALRVARLYYVEGHTLAEIGKKLGLGRKEVSQLLRELVGRVLLREPGLGCGGVTHEVGCI